MAKRIYRIEKDGNFWGISSESSHLAALAASLSIGVNDLPADFPRQSRGDVFTAWINNSVYVVKPTTPTQ
ncbi:hypothetical protein [Enterovibrio norvegicus]|uniref:hypothetical protein n=1 Tax=Enterovibrio norvegicus TaxID=188144 RepID=UPI003550E5E0